MQLLLRFMLLLAHNPLFHSFRGSRPAAHPVPPSTQALLNLCSSPWPYQTFSQVCYLFSQLWSLGFRELRTGCHHGEGAKGFLLQHFSVFCSVSYSLPGYSDPGCLALVSQRLLSYLADVSITLPAATLRPSTRRAEHIAEFLCWGWLPVLLCIYPY